MVIITEINIDAEDYYLHEEPEKNKIIKKRLIEIKELGLETCGIAQFGLPNLMSGLYIEHVWHKSNLDWASYINWIKELKNRK